MHDVRGRGARRKTLAGTHGYPPAIRCEHASCQVPGGTLLAQESPPVRRLGTRGYLVAFEGDGGGTWVPAGTREYPDPEHTYARTNYGQETRDGEWRGFHRFDEGNSTRTSTRNFGAKTTRTRRARGRSLAPEKGVLS